MIKFQHIQKRTLSPEDEEQIRNQWESEDKAVVLNSCSRLERYSGQGRVREEVVNHLFRVTSGLESTVLGESAIQGQVKKAYSESPDGLSTTLHRLFQRALFVGRRVRTETALSRGAISYSQASVELVLKNMEDNLQDANITLTGAHAMNESIIRFLVSKGARTIFIANRTFIKAQHLAERHQCTALTFDKLNEVLAKTDVLISATAAPHLIIKKERFPQAKKMLVLDLAMPRDVEQTIGDLQDVHLISLEEIESRMHQNLNLRRKEIKKAEVIIREEVDRFQEEQKQRVKQIA